MDQQWTIKQGETFGKTFTISDDGTPITEIAGRLKAQVRDGDNNLQANMIFAETSTPGTYTMVSDHDTSDWPVSTALYFDMVYTTADNRDIPSDTVIIRVKKKVTQ
jgi:hypothetical protein